MTILTFEQFIFVIEKLSSDDKEQVLKQLNQYTKEYLAKYCFVKISEGKIQIMPKISIIPSYEDAPFNGDKEIKKLISKVTSDMEMTIQLNGIIDSLEYLKENLDDSYSPHLEMIFAGCIATFFSFFKESKGFNKIGEGDDFYKFENIDKNIISNETLKEIFFTLEKLRDSFYCHKQSAIGYNILGIYFMNNRIEAHTKEETKPFFIYSDMSSFVEQFISLVKYTLSYVKDERLKNSSKYLNNYLNNKRYKEKLINLIEKSGNDEITHSKKIQEILKSLSLMKDRIDIQGNKLDNN